METNVLLEQILKQLQILNAKLDQHRFDLAEFSERFEEVMTIVEDERRLDLIKDNY